MLRMAFPQPHLIMLFFVSASPLAGYSDPGQKMKAKSTVSQENISILVYSLKVRDSFA